MSWSETTTIDAPAALVWASDDRGRGLAESDADLDEGEVPGPRPAPGRKPGPDPTAGAALRDLDRESTRAERSLRWQTSRLGITRTGTHRVTPEEAGCSSTLHVERPESWRYRSDCGSGQRYGAPLRVENAGFMGRAQRQAAPPGHRKEH